MAKSTKLSILAGTLLALGPGQLFAGSMMESESNNPLSNAQLVPGTASQVEIHGAILATHDTNDVDFYTFQANAGDVLTLDIDYGSSADENGLDTIIAIFDGNGMGLRANDDAYTGDPGSEDLRDSRIDNFVVPATGTYVVGVSTYPRQFRHHGEVSSGELDEGTYVLIIDGLPVSTMHISMEVKPGNRDVSRPINPKSNGKLPVALLGSETFDVQDVDVDTLTFGASGYEPSLHKCAKRSSDVNRDGHPDLVCHFYTARTNFDGSSLEGRARGRTKDGVEFEGAAYLKVVPNKKPRD